MWVVLFYFGVVVAEMEIPTLQIKSQQQDYASTFLNSNSGGISFRNTEMPTPTSTHIIKTTENCPHSDILINIQNVLKSLLNDKNKAAEPEKTVYVLGALKHYLEEYNHGANNNDIINELKPFETLNNDNSGTDHHKIARQLDEPHEENLRAKIIFQYEVPTQANIHCRETIITLIKMINIAYSQFLDLCKESGKCSETLKFPDVQYSPHPNVVEQNILKPFVLSNIDTSVPFQKSDINTNSRQPFIKPVKSKTNNDILNIISGLKPNLSSKKHSSNNLYTYTPNLVPSILNHIESAYINDELKKLTDLMNNNDLKQIQKPVYLPQPYVKDPNGKITFTVTAEGKIVPVMAKIENPLIHNVSPSFIPDNLNTAPKKVNTNTPKWLGELIKLYIQNPTPSPIASETENSNSQMITPGIYFKNVHPNSNRGLFYEIPKQINISEPSGPSFLQYQEPSVVNTNYNPYVISENQNLIYPYNAIENPELNSDLGHQIHQILHPGASNEYRSKYPNNLNPETFSPNNFNPRNVEDKLIDLHWLDVTNPDRLISDKNGIVELTYIMNPLKPEHYEPYYAKFRLPYSIFLVFIQDLLNKKPFLKDYPNKLYLELLANSNFISSFADTKTINPNDIAKLVTNGATVTARILTENDTAVNNEIKIIQELNARLRPEEILKISGLGDEKNIESQRTDVNLNGMNVPPKKKVNDEDIKPVYTNVQPVGYYSFYNQIPSSYVYSYNSNPLSQLNVRLPAAYNVLRPNLMSTLNRQVNTGSMPSYQYSYLRK